MADFRKGEAEFQPGRNAHRSPGPVPSSLLPSRARTAFQERRVQCGGRLPRFEIEASPDMQPKVQEAPGKRHLSTEVAFAIVPASSIVSDGGASFPAAGSV